MDKVFKDKMDDLNSFVTTLEKKVKRGTIINIVIYGIIIILFLVYAIIIPAEMKKITSVEDGPKTLVSLLESNLPDDHEILARAKAEIPGLISTGVDQLMDLIPNGETILLDTVSDMTDQLSKYVYDELTTELVTFLEEQIRLIKKEYPELSSPNAKKQFNEICRIHLRDTLEEMVKNGHLKIKSYQAELEKYKLPDNQLTAKELAEKRVLLSFIRLADDEDYREQLSDTLVNTLIQNYEALISPAK